jgi:gamma-glutamylcyclotransferase (GGCT)/AIG2-like uncharacterized protein YtfP
MRPLPDHLFVYGTLRSGSTSPMAARVARDTVLVARGVMRGRLFDAGVYPAMITDVADPWQVHGELLHLPDDKVRRRRLLSELDLYEGVLHGPAEQLSLFVRLVVDVRLDDGAMMPAWAYVYHRDVSGLTEIGTGDWVQHCAERVALAV